MLSLKQDWIQQSVGQAQIFDSSWAWTTLLHKFVLAFALGAGPVPGLLLSEIFPSRIRAKAMAFCMAVHWGWRVCLWVPVIPAAVLVLAMELCVESPHWLFKKGRGADAEATFEKLLGGSHIKAAIAELSKLDRGEDLETVKFTEIFHSHHFRVVFIGATLFALQQLSGINAMFYFSSAVFKRAGVPSDIANMFVGLVNLSGSFIAIILMDKLGRKVLLLGSFLGMVMSMGLQVSATSFVSASGALYLSVGSTTCSFRDGLWGKKGIEEGKSLYWHLLWELVLSLVSSCQKYFLVG